MDVTKGMDQSEENQEKELPAGAVEMPPIEGYSDKQAYYEYKGVVFPGIIIRTGEFEDALDFDLRPTDVLVSSYPKTGTTWTQEIVYMLTHGCQETTKGDLLETRFPHLEFPFPGLKVIRAMEGLRCLKTHLPFQLLPKSFATSGAKLVYVTRNPRDTVLSYYHFLKMMTTTDFHGTKDQFIDSFIQDKAMYSPFFGHVLGYWQARKLPNVFFTTYEELHVAPLDTIRRIAEFLGVSASEEQLQHVVRCTSFSSMATNPSTNYEHWKDTGFSQKGKGSFMRKGKVGGWQKELTEEQVQRFQEWEDQNLKDSDFRFTFTVDQ